MRRTIHGSLAAATLLSLTSPALALAEASAPPPASSPVRTMTQLVLPPPKDGRARPLVVVVADNAGAETTDFVVPYGVLKESGLADVRSLSTHPGPARLFLTLAIQADQTLAEFDHAEPAGADIVIVPAQVHPKDPALVAWLRSQAERGATIVSICEGARVLAATGLLDGRRAATHWHALRDLEKQYPNTTWVRDRRYVQDGPIISTTGVSASIPVSLALIEAMGGRAAAAETAERLGAPGWGAEHRTADYSLSPPDYAGALLAMAAFWRRDTLQAPIADGADEIALALQADAWSRTFRARVVTTSAGEAPVRSRRGLVLIPDQAPRPGRRSITLRQGTPLAQLDVAISDIEQRYGWRAARLTTLGMEYTPAAQGRKPGAIP